MTIVKIVPPSVSLTENPVSGRVVSLTYRVGTETDQWAWREALLSEKHLGSPMMVQSAEIYIERNLHELGIHVGV